MNYDEQLSKIRKIDIAIKIESFSGLKTKFKIPLFSLIKGENRLLVGGLLKDLNTTWYNAINRRVNPTVDLKIDS